MVSDDRRLTSLRAQTYPRTYPPERAPPGSAGPVPLR